MKKFDLYRNSFLFLSVEQRIAPEILVNELMREVFSKSFFNQSGTKAKQLFPTNVKDELADLTAEESYPILALLEAVKGRVRTSSQDKGLPYYMCVYPFMTILTWQRRKTPRVLRDNLFYAAIGQSFAHYPDVERESGIENFASALVTALSGNEEDILMQVARTFDYETNSKIREHVLTKDKAIERVIKLIKNSWDPDDSNDDRDESSKRDFIIDLGEEDPLAIRIREDFCFLLSLESKIPRLQWISFLRCFLRVALSSWILGNIKLTIEFNKAILEVLSGELELDKFSFNEKIKDRYKDIFIPSEFGTSIMYELVDSYIKSRIELSEIGCISRNVIAFSDNDRFSLRGPKFSIEDYLEKLKKESKQIFHVTGVEDFHQFRQNLTKEVQQVKQYLKPRGPGVGQALFEVLLMLSRTGDDKGDAGYLLTKVPRKESHVVFPGEELISTFVMLAAMRVKNANSRFTLLNLLEHFAYYGVNFFDAEVGRKSLVKCLINQGYMHGSPDAGFSVSIKARFGV
jgi:hypothetical protein